MNNLKITIEGTTGSGKSALLIEINQHLTKLGFDVKIDSIENDDGSLSHMKKMRLLEYSDLLKGISDKGPIKLETKQTNRTKL